MLYLQGDSGGPLVCWNNNFWQLVGVFSFLTRGCNVPMMPSVFTNVQQFHGWITNELGQSLEACFVVV